MVLLETYGVGWTYEDTQGMYMCLIVLCLYLLRNVSPFFEACWNIVKLIMIIIFIIITAGMVTKWIKKFF
jgi:multisubunit Na+/H+ antiporter MnhG subunit